MQQNSYMNRAFELAAKGSNKVYPNPKVGAVVVKNGKIIAEGYHATAGFAHAEVIALKRAGRKAKGAELFVSMEPCSTHGKTPPCTEALLQAGLQKITYGAPDPNPENRGKAARVLKKGGLPLIYLDYESANRELNRVFYHRLGSKMPYVILKAALSQDGRMSDYQGKVKWITGPQARKHSHFLRREVDAILIGARTYNTDNPRLTPRIPGRKNFKDPIKVLLSGTGVLKTSGTLLHSEQKSPVWIVTTDAGFKYLTRKVIKNKNHTLLNIGLKSARVPLKRLLVQLGKRGVSALMVEGGQDLLSQFITKRYFHELHLYIGPCLLGGPGPLLWGEQPKRCIQDLPDLVLNKQLVIGPDLFLEYHNRKSQL